MIYTKFLLSVVALLISTTRHHQVDGSSYLSVSSYSCSSNTGVGVTDFSVDCDQCSFGSKVGITADLYFSQDQSSDVQATVWLSKAYVSFLTIIKQQDVDFCKATEPTDDDAGSECPAAGSYTVSTDLDIPDYNGWVTSFQTHLLMTDEDGATMLACTATISGGYQRMYTFVGMAALGGLVLVGALMERKYRRVVTTGGGSNRAMNDLATSFEMMTDPSVGVAGRREEVATKKPGVIV